MVLIDSADRHSDGNRRLVYPGAALRDPGLSLYGFLKMGLAITLPFGPTFPIRILPAWSPCRPNRQGSRRSTRPTVSARRASSPPSPGWPMQGSRWRAAARCAWLPQRPEAPRHAKYRLGRPPAVTPSLCSSQKAVGAPTIRSWPIPRRAGRQPHTPAGGSSPSSVECGPPRKAQRRRRGTTSRSARSTRWRSSRRELPAPITTN